jgi:hypothetical protein
MAAGDGFVEILSPTFATGHGDRPCISFTGGAWPSSAPWDSFALDDVRLDVVSYPVPVAESPPALAPSGAIRDGESVTHVPATWSIRAPVPGHEDRRLPALQRDGRRLRHHRQQPHGLLPPC